MPCDKNDLGEAMLPMILAQNPSELAALLAGGYNPEEPNVDRKFLDFLRKNC